ncbi:hypothetical protein R3P38DRAFT_3230775 [Favolaschia claudopus]|uniref:Uncharacterized protein n=1 Tax=Favolaschia claudopus TaxID=2862362 RepID=A0AAV9ZLJ3_9AGAR
MRRRSNGHKPNPLPRGADDSPETSVRSPLASQQSTMRSRSNGAKLSSTQPNPLPRVDFYQLAPTSRRSTIPKKRNRRRITEGAPPLNLQRPRSTAYRPLTHHPDPLHAVPAVHSNDSMDSIRQSAKLLDTTEEVETPSSSPVVRPPPGRNRESGSSQISNRIPLAMVDHSQRHNQFTSQRSVRQTSFSSSSTRHQHRTPLTHGTVLVPDSADMFGRSPLKKQQEQRRPARRMQSKNDSASVEQVHTASFNAADASDEDLELPDFSRRTQSKNDGASVEQVHTASFNAADSSDEDNDGASVEQVHTASFNAADSSDEDNDGASVEQVHTASFNAADSSDEDNDGASVEQARTASFNAADSSDEDNDGASVEQVHTASFNAADASDEDLELSDFSRRTQSKNDGASVEQARTASFNAADSSDEDNDGASVEQVHTASFNAADSSDEDLELYEMEVYPPVSVPRVYSNPSPNPISFTSVPFRDHTVNTSSSSSSSIVSPTSSSPETTTVLDTASGNLSVKRHQSFVATPSPKRRKIEAPPSTLKKMLSGMKSLMSFRSHFQAPASTPPSSPAGQYSMRKAYNGDQSSPLSRTQSSQPIPPSSQSVPATPPQRMEEPDFAHSVAPRDDLLMKLNTSFSFIETEFVSGEYDQSKEGFVLLLTEHRQQLERDVKTAFSEVGKDRFTPPKSVRFATAPPALMAQNAEHLAIARMVHALGYLSAAIEANCAPCWVATGRMFPSDHPAFSSGRCSVNTMNAGDNILETLRPPRLSAAGCATCWFPQPKAHPNVPFSNHSTTGQCIHPGAFKHIAWAVYMTPVLWQDFSTELRRIYKGEKNWFRPGNPNLGNTASSMTVETYVEWLWQEREGILNVGHLAYWLLHRNGNMGDC